MIPARLALPDLAPYSMSFGGLGFGNWSGTPYGQAYQLAPGGITGLDMPNAVTGDVQRPRDHGELAGLDLLGGRDIVIDLIVGQTATATLQENLRTLAAALTPPGAVNVNDGAVEQPLFIQMPDGLYAVMARVRKKGFTVNQSYILTGGAALSVMFHATDPRIYAVPTRYKSIALPTRPSGITFPVSFPLAFPGGAVVASESAYLEGNMDCRPVLIFEGPLTNPSAGLDDGSEYPPTLSFANPASGGDFTLDDGDTLTVDVQAKTVTWLPAGDSVPIDVLNWLVPGSEWWTLTPGENTVTFYSDDSTATAGLLNFMYASAYDSL